MSREGVKMRTFDKKLMEEREYWLNKLAGQVEPANLRLDFERPSTYQAQTGIVTILFSDELQAKLARLTGNSPLLVYTTLMTALKICLNKYTDYSSIVVGSPALLKEDSNQPKNALVLLDEIESSSSFRDLLTSIRETLMQAYARQSYSYTQLITDLRRIEPPNRCALFDFALMLKDFHGELSQVKNDVSLIFSQSAQGLAGEIEYNRRLFKPGSIERFRDRFINILERALNNSELPIRELDLLTDVERHRLLFEWNAATLSFPAEKCVHQLFEARVQRTPAAVAAAFEDQKISYSELNRRANQLAHLLRRLGVGAETKVGILMDRSLEMLIGLLGIIKAGGAFVPFDPLHPRHRLELMLGDAEISILLTERRWTNSFSEYRGEILCLDSDLRMIEQQSTENPTNATVSDNLAYVIYTSGSTGRPKGVSVSHRALVNFLLAVADEFNLNAADHVLQFASISFDVAIEEIFPAWLRGAAVIMRDLQQLASPTSMTRIIEQEEVTAMELPTAYWQEWVSELSRSGKPVPACLRLVIVGGEKASTETVTKWREFRKQLKNVYGVTEATISSTSYTDSEDDSQSGLPIGKPLTNTQIYVLDREMKPAGISIAGELYIGGEGVARGYLSDVALTAERFVPNPFGDKRGMRLYKTGDIAIYLPSGDIEFIGRRDDQVKIRGFRIELGEIESVLKQHPGVDNAVIAVGASAGPDLHSRSKEMEGPHDLMDQEYLIRNINQLQAETAEQLFAEIERLSEEETAATLAMEMQLNNQRSKTKIRRLKDFDIILRLKDDRFIAPPRESQRNWLIRRALNELADDLISLDEVSRRMVPGAARSRLTSEWSKSEAQYDQSELIIQGQQVMQDWERPLMEAMAEIVTESHGDILELGFGMGISATYIQKFGVRSYTVVEYNDGVVKQFHKWKERYPGRDIKIIHGRWHDVADQLGVYDGIFFDTVPSNEEEYLREVIDNVVMAEDIFPIASRCLRKGGIFTWYTNEIDSFSRRHQRLALKYFSSLSIQVVKPLHPPQDCHYWWADSMVAVKAIK
jgi:amino acid adenylation domain-containing protein